MLPSELQEELEEVRFANGMGYERKLFKLVVGKGRLEYQLEKFKKDIVDLATERMSIYFGNIR